MGVVLNPHPPSSRLSWHARVEVPTAVESRSPLPAFKNLGRGVF
jgi:hypothetical protein